ncbi:unnamed protein product, partial [Prorocentrum cordatum]
RNVEKELGRITLSKLKEMFPEVVSQLQRERCFGVDDDNIDGRALRAPSMKFTKKEFIDMLMRQDVVQGVMKKLALLDSPLVSDLAPLTRKTLEETHAGVTEGQLSVHHLQRLQHGLRHAGDHGPLEQPLLSPLPSPMQVVMQRAEERGEASGETPHLFGIRELAGAERLPAASLEAGAEYQGRVTGASLFDGLRVDIGAQVEAIVRVDLG